MSIYVAGKYEEKELVRGVPHQLGVGSYVEMGVAIGHRIPVVAWLPDDLPGFAARAERWGRCIFSAMATVAKTEHHLVAWASRAHAEQHGRWGVQVPCRSIEPQEARHVR